MADVDSKVADCMRQKIQVLFEMRKAVRDRLRVSKQDTVDDAVGCAAVAVGSQTLPGQPQPVDCTGKQRKSTAIMTGQGLERERFRRQNRCPDGPRAREALLPEASAPPVGVH